MTLILGRGTSLSVTSVTGNFLIWNSGNWNQKNWGPPGSSGASLTVEGVAALLLQDGSTVVVENGPLTYESATQTMTAGIESVSFQGQLLANFTVLVSGFSAAFFDASYSDGSGGSITAWAWNFGDGGTSTLQNPVHDFGADNAYTVTLTVTDSDGGTSTATLLVIINSSGRYLFWNVGNWNQANWY